MCVIAYSHGTPTDSSSTADYSAQISTEGISFIPVDETEANESFTIPQFKFSLIMDDPNLTIEDEEIFWPITVQVDGMS